MTVERFDIIVFGGGKAGKTLAMDQAKAGRRVAMIERGLIGGSCINVACIPSKTLIRSAQVRALIGKASDFGAHAAPPLDMAAVARRTADVVGEMVSMNQRAFESSGLELVQGWGRFVGQRIIEVGTADGPRLLTAPAIYLNTGTTADVPSVKGMAEAHPITHVEALTLGDLPEHLLVLGAGYIGLELGQAYRRLGAAVTIVEQGPQIAAREDADIASAMRAALEEDGVVVLTGFEVAEITGRSGDSVSMVLSDGTVISGSHLLVAAGRRPMTSGIGLELAGVEIDDRGFVKTDAQLRTTADGIWALGEIAGTPMFTHASLDDYRVIKSAMSGGGYLTTGRLIPYCVFIDPELARVGLNEREATALGVDYRLFSLSMDVVPRARTLGERKGLMKALVGTDDRILGFTMLGAQAGEVMTAVHLAMLGSLPYTAVRDAIIAHPTLAEGLGMLFATVPASR
ncbi:mercuric reductase [Sphingomonas sp. NBWT7]|uniref:dihydrolipoyl dehydrogenase family protein n=1 Tax=Sphingomonas sp. NBWT7 TaxID=2596913 RepID=UPI00162A26E9|nr:FAD-dependent oxidoreductase [Sphingomonas sp. NBWT7]QNE31085.1 mercuric reductase [Sphingomonas sp. NBWT7]